MIITCPQCAAAYSVDAVAFGREPRSVECSACGHRWRQAPPIAGPAHPGPTPETATPETATPERSPMAGPPAEDTAPAFDGGDGRRTRATATRPEAAAVEGDPARPPERTSEAAPFVDGAPPGKPDQPDAVDDGDDVDFSPEGPPEDDTVVAGADQSTPLTGPAEAIADGERRPPSAPAVAAVQRRPWWQPVLAGAIGFALLLAAVIGLRETITSAVPALAHAYALVGLGTPAIGEGLDIRDVSTTREWSGGDDVLSVTGLVVNGGERRRDVPSLRVGLFDGEDQEVQGVTVPPARATLGPGESLRFQARIVGPSDTARRIRVRFQVDPPPQS